MSLQQWKDNRKAKRNKIKAKLVFYLDPEVIVADSFDMSEKGIRIETSEPIDLRVQVELEDHLQEYQAQLVWAQEKYDGGMCYGLQFVVNPEE